MSEKVRAILGHLALAAIYLLSSGLEPIHGEYFFASFITFFLMIGLWAALGTKYSAWFSLLFALGLWFLVGATLMYNLISYDMAQTNHKMRSEGSPFFLALACFFVGMIIGSGFAIGRIGVAVVRFFTPAKETTAQDSTTISEQ